MFSSRFAVLLALIAFLGISLPAQQAPDTNAPAELRLAGVVRTVEGAPVPGSALRVIQTSTGKAWICWTDENGKFDFPGLPGGHYRVEISQLGFAPTTKEMDWGPGPRAPIELKLEIATLAAINAPPATPESAKSVFTNAASSNEAAKSQPSGETPANPANPASTGTAAANNATPASGGRLGGRFGQPGGPGGVRQGQGGGQGGGRRAFQQVGLNGNSQDQSNADNSGEDEQNLSAATGQLGQAASADAVQMMGTVAMGQIQNQTGGGPGFGDGGLGGPDTQIGFGNAGAIPGQAAQGPGSGQGFPGGGPGGGGFGGPGDGGGGRGPAQRRGPQGNSGRRPLPMPFK